MGQSSPGRMGSAVKRGLLGRHGGAGCEMASRCGSERPRKFEAEHLGAPRREAESPGEEAALSASLLTGLAVWPLPPVCSPWAPHVPPPCQLPGRGPLHPCVWFTFR